MKKARHVAEIMIRRNISPDIFTYNILIVGYCLQGQMDEANEIFHSIVEEGLEPTYSPTAV